MVSDQYMTQARMVAAIKAAKAAIMIVREAEDPIKFMREVQAVSMASC